jgi:hypothetical protein
VRKELIELLDGMRWNACKDNAQPFEWIKLEKFTGGDKAAQNRECLAAAVTPEERPVAATEGNTAQANVRSCC